MTNQLQSALLPNPFQNFPNIYEQQLDDFVTINTSDYKNQKVYCSSNLICKPSINISDVQFSKFLNDQIKSLVDSQVSRYQPKNESIVQIDPRNYLRLHSQNSTPETLVMYDEIPSLCEKTEKIILSFQEIQRQQQLMKYLHSFSSKKFKALQNIVLSDHKSARIKLSFKKT